MVGGQGVVVEAIDGVFSVALSVVGGVPNVAVDTVVTLGGGEGYDFCNHRKEHLKRSRMAQISVS